jgi:hypothetical protein
MKSQKNKYTLVTAPDRVDDRGAKRIDKLIPKTAAGWLRAVLWLAGHPFLPPRTKSERQAKAGYAETKHRMQEMAMQVETR